MMVEPILKAAMEVSVLLARSFFMEFSLAVLALLARLRVLVQQILLDVVSLSNTVSSISQNKQSVKINQKGIEVFREYYPSNKEFISLECVWKVDKFVLLERAIDDDDEDVEKMEEDQPKIECSSLMEKGEDLTVIPSTSNENEHQDCIQIAAAFISVKRPATSTYNVTTLGHSRDSEKEPEGKEDSFFNLLTSGGNVNNSLF
ncbi:hypothetical protein LINPERPRIM_LOCUS5482 [Linum perenne]